MSDVAHPLVLVFYETSDMLVFYETSDICCIDMNERGNSDQILLSEMSLPVIEVLIEKLLPKIGEE